MLMGSSRTIPHFPQLTSDMAALFVSGGKDTSEHSLAKRLDLCSRPPPGLARSVERATIACGSDPRRRTARSVPNCPQDPDHRSAAPPLLRHRGHYARWTLTVLAD